MFGWSAVDIPMLVALPVLLLISAFFSGSETALFGLTGPERMTLRRERPRLSRVLDQLLANPRMLLITILVGNMTANVLYFVITSVLLMNSELGVIGQMALAVAFLVLIILFGEVSPKLVANTLRGRFAAVVSPALLTVHGLLGPLRIFLDRLVVGPLSRLTAPATEPPSLDHDELAALVGVSADAGVIDSDEQRILQDVMALSRLKVRSVMTPRVRIAAVPATATRTDVLEIVGKTPFTNLPVFGRGLDDIVGILRVKRFLLQDEGPPTAGECAVAAQFVPEVATLDQLLHHLRAYETELAVAVDEFGGTAGVVALEDVVEEIVGDIASAPERSQTEPVQIGEGRWRVGGNLSVHEWAEAFGQQEVAPEISTIGGLIVARLGRAPQVGDSVSVGNVQLEVERVERSRVESVIVTLAPEEAGS
jgi:putative hemolysin